MKTRQIRLIGAVVSMIAFTFSATARECDVPMTVVEIRQPDDVPLAASEFLKNRLTSIVSTDGSVAGAGDTRFFIAGRFNHIASEVLPGPPKQTSIHTELTLYIGDTESETVFSSCTLDLRGVGNSSQKALISALRLVNSDNTRVKTFIEKGSDKILEYYDSHSDLILEKAKKAAALQCYDEAMYYAFSIPECCRSYSKAVSVGIEYFQNGIDRDGQKIFELARAAWITSPDANGASVALPILWEIPLGSSAYPSAEKLINEIHSVVKDDKYFETRRKYEDETELKKMKINSAREIGVAWGKNQQPQTTNLTWLR